MHAQEVAPDGSPVAVYLALPAEPAFTAVLDHLDPGASVLDLGCGVGRLVNLLARPHREVWGVDESPAMLRHLAAEVTAVSADLRGLDLGRRFDAVVLASHLVNVADPELQRGFLTAVADHLDPAGTAYLQRHDPSPGAYDVGVREQVLPTARGPLAVTLEVHERRGPWFRATSTMAFPDASWAQTFDAELLDDDALAARLSAVGLELGEVLDATWVTATAAARSRRPGSAQAPAARGA